MVNQRKNMKAVIGTYPNGEEICFSSYYTASKVMGCSPQSIKNSCLSGVPIKKCKGIIFKHQ
jgi:hypothetical protein